MRRPSNAASLMLCVWMMFVIVVFFLVTIPPHSRLVSLLPTFVWTMRDFVFPLFHSPTVL